MTSDCCCDIGTKCCKVTQNILVKGCGISHLFTPFPTPPPPPPYPYPYPYPPLSPFGFVMECWNDIYKPCNIGSMIYYNLHRKFKRFSDKSVRSFDTHGVLLYIMVFQCVHVCLCLSAYFWFGVLFLVLLKYFYLFVLAVLFPIVLLISLPCFFRGEIGRSYF